MACIVEKFEDCHIDGPVYKEKHIEAKLGVPEAILKKEEVEKPEEEKLDEDSEEPKKEEEPEIAVLYEDGKTPTYEDLTKAEKQVEERKANEKELKARKAGGWAGAMSKGGRR